MALCLAVSSPALAGGAQEAQENLTQFAQIAGVLQGFTPRGELWRGELMVGEATVIIETLMFGNEYLVLATGDNDATDINLELYDSDLNLVTVDVDDDDTPVITITPPTSGAYTIRVTLVAAATPAAWYALQVMYR